MERPLSDAGRDLDGPLRPAQDRPNGLRYDGNLIYPPDSALWEVSSGEHSCMIIAGLEIAVRLTHDSHLAGESS